MDEATFYIVGTELGDAGFRPVSISAEGVGGDVRFSVIWIQDQIGLAGDWGLRFGMTGSGYQDSFVEFDAAGFRPIAIDAYGAGDAPLYIALWIRDNDTLYNGIHGVDEETLLAEMESQAEGGFNPIWLSAHSNGATPTFSAIWVNDGHMRIGATDLDNGQPAWRKRTSDGYRLQQISGYELDVEGDDGEETVERRFAATWTKIEQTQVPILEDCDFVQWEGFLEQTSSQYQIKASVQTPLGQAKTVAPGSLTLEPTDFGQPFRIANLELHAVVPGDTIFLEGIQGTPNNFFEDGDILVLRTRPGDTVHFIESASSNISLRKWTTGNPELDMQAGIEAACSGLGLKCPPVVGQEFLMHNHQYRLVLQYDADSQSWNELQRNDLAPRFCLPHQPRCIRRRRDPLCIGLAGSSHPACMAGRKGHQTESTYLSARVDLAGVRRSV